MNSYEKLDAILLSLEKTISDYDKLYASYKDAKNSNIDISNKEISLLAKKMIACKLKIDKANAELEKLLKNK